MKTRVIAVIDDDPDIRSTIRDLFETEGFAVHDFEDPLAAVPALAEIRPDFIILDARMPQINGIDLLPRLRFELPDTPVMILTAYTSFALYRQALEAGACHMMCKPFSSRALVQMVTQILEKQAQANKSENMAGAC